jgi:hypothetical protein
VLDDFFQKVGNGDITSDAFIGHGASSPKASIKEGVDHPGDEHTVVDNEHPTTRDTGDTNSSEAG